MYYASERQDVRNLSWNQRRAIARHERRRLSATVNALCLAAVGLTTDEVRLIFHQCDYPVAMVDDERVSLDAKGFWRVDREMEPELRETVLTQVAFHSLQQLGLDDFLNQNNGEGWMIPETLRLADYGLGHDDRAKEHQPVAPRLGPRFLPWQLEQDIEESWEECARHAEKIEALLGIGPNTSPHVAENPAPPYPAGPSDLFGKALPTNLFGQPVASPKRRKR
jgi:hypothetical protein